MTVEVLVAALLVVLPVACASGGGLREGGADGALRPRWRRSRRRGRHARLGELSGVIGSTSPTSCFQQLDGLNHGRTHGPPETCSSAAVARARSVAAVLGILSRRGSGPERQDEARTLQGRRGRLPRRERAAQSRGARRSTPVAASRSSCSELGSRARERRHDVAEPLGCRWGRRSRRGAGHRARRWLLRSAGRWRRRTPRVTQDREGQVSHGVGVGRDRAAGSALAALAPKSPRRAALNASK